MSKKVKFVKNGFESVMSDMVADIYAKKGKVKILGDVKEAEREAPPKKEKKADGDK